MTVCARHIGYRTDKMVVLPCSATSAEDAMDEIDENVVGGSNFTFWTDIEDTADFVVEKPTLLKDVLGSSSGGLLDVYGGEYEWDKSII